jgi:hypothetical protein
MGESSVALGYRRHGTTHVFTISQDEGAVPLRIIFEPALPIGALQAIRIDGIEARLDARPIGDRLQISAQVMLDHNRTIEIVGEPSNP